MHQAVQRESKQTRETAGIIDGSTLGKIEIKGKDALEFMNLMYTNAFTKMRPMTSRYALMLGEDGMIMDDGIVCKINDKHFEVLVRQMLRKVEITDSGDTIFLEKQLVSKEDFMEYNDSIYGKKYITDSGDSNNLKVGQIIDCLLYTSDAADD